MGVLFYGGPDAAIEIDDVMLAHLKVVVTTKLRRGESFTVSWRHPEQQPGGRSTIWLHPAIPLRFVFDTPEAESLNPEWLERLSHSADSTGGIRLISDHFKPSEETSGEWPVQGAS